MNIFKMLACTGLLGACASAGIITADFNETLDLPFPGDGGTGPRLEQLLGVSLPGTPPQLTAADIISNPSNWSESLNVSFDPSTNILTLFGDGSNDYQIITITLSNLIFDIAGEVVTGIVPISTGNAVVTDTGNSDPPPVTTPFFTANSFGVTYSAPNITTTANNFNITTASDTFQVELATVPEPGTLLLMGMGAVALMFGQRRRLQ
jgi:PEP-CTERM motif-containing protein